MPRPRARKSTFPASVARSFEKALLKIIQQVAQEVLQRLEREVKPLLDKNALILQSQGSPRLHGIGDELRAIFSRIRELLLRILPQGLAIKIATDINRSSQSAADKDVSKQIERAIGEKVSGVLFPTLRLRVTAEALVAETVRLIQDLPEEYVRRVERAVYDALERGIPYSELAQQLSQELDIAKNRATRIAIDQINRHYNWSAQVRYEEMGVKHFIFITAQDERVCPICQPLNNTRHKVENLRDFLPRHVNCRCSSIADPEELAGAFGF